MNITFRIALMLSCLTILTGCFKVQDTEGLRLAYNDVERVESYADTYRHVPNVTGPEHNHTMDLYNEAKKEINAYLKVTIDDASDYTVNEPAENYNKLTASADTARFVEQVRNLREKYSAEDGTVHLTAEILVGDLAAKVLAEIWKLHQQAQQDAYDRFTKTVESNLVPVYPYH